jgi:hypothetical protein
MIFLFFILFVYVGLCYQAYSNKWCDSILNVHQVRPPRLYMAGPSGTTRGLRSEDSCDDPYRIRLVREHKEATPAHVLT